MSERMTVRSRDGLALEAESDLAPDARASIVFCHPHPGYGGTMNAPLLVALRDDLVERGFGVLRFNFRGGGASEGTSSLGEAEVADAAGAIDVAREAAPGRPLALLGWSFGGSVAIRTAAAEPVDACVAIAPAVRGKEGITAGLPSPDELGLEVPLLIVIGSNDEQISTAECKGFSAGVGGAEFVEMPGANHFFWAKYPQLTATIGTWLERVL